MPTHVGPIAHQGRGAPRRGKVLKLALAKAIPPPVLTRAEHVIL